MSRPRRNSPKLPDRLTVARRLKVRPPAATAPVEVAPLLVVVPLLPMPLLAAIAASSQKLAPRRLAVLPEGAIPLWRPALLFTLSKARSTTPNRVTDDWAWALAPRARVSTAAVERAERTNRICMGFPE